MIFQEESGDKDTESSYLCDTELEDHPTVHKIGCEEKCIEMDTSAQENHFCCPSSEEFQRYEKNWYITLNK